MTRPNRTTRDGAVGPTGPAAAAAAAMRRSPRFQGVPFSHVQPPTDTEICSIVLCFWFARSDSPLLSLFRRLKLRKKSVLFFYRDRALDKGGYQGLPSGVVIRSPRFQGGPLGAVTSPSSRALAARSAMTLSYSAKARPRALSACSRNFDAGYGPALRKARAADLLRRLPPSSRPPCFPSATTTSTSGL